MPVHSSPSLSGLTSAEQSRLRNPQSEYRVAIHCHIPDPQGTIAFPTLHCPISRWRKEQQIIILTFPPPFFPNH